MKAEANQQYEFKAKLAWKLEKNETRTKHSLGSRIRDPIFDP